MAEAVKVTLGTVHRVFGIAQACLKIVNDTRALQPDGKIDTPYDEKWQNDFQAKSDLLIAALARQFGSAWTSLPADRVIGADAQEAYEEVRKLIPK